MLIQLSIEKTDVIDGKNRRVIWAGRIEYTIAFLNNPPKDATAFQVDANLRLSLVSVILRRIIQRDDLFFTSSL
jgi:hypothetical protein